PFCVVKMKGAVLALCGFVGASPGHLRILPNETDGIGPPILEMEPINDRQLAGLAIREMEQVLPDLRPASCGKTGRMKKMNSPARLLDFDPWHGRRIFIDIGIFCRQLDDSADVEPDPGELLQAGGERGEMVRGIAAVPRLPGIRGVVIR